MINKSNNITEGMFSAIDQIRQDSKDVRDFVKKVFADREFKKMSNDKDFIKYLKSIYEGTMIDEEAVYVSTRNDNGSITTHIKEESVNEAQQVNLKSVDVLRRAVQKINKKYKVQVSKIGPTKGEVEIELGSGNHPDRDYRAIDNLVKKIGIKNYSVFNESDGVPSGYNPTVEARDPNLYYVLYRKIGKSGNPAAAGYESYKDAEKFAQSVSKTHTIMILPKKMVKGMKVESVVNEAASREAMGIAGFTGTRGSAVQKFIDDYNLNAKKLYKFVSKGKLSDRMDFVTAIAGNPGNKYQGKIVGMFGESVVSEASIKGKNNKTGESFGMVIGSDKKNREGDFEVTIRKTYSSRISSYKFMFDKSGNLIAIKDYGYSMDGKFPDMKGGGSVKSVKPNPRETITQIAKVTSPAFAKKIYQHVKKVNESVKEATFRPNSGTMSGGTYGLDKRKYELKRDVKGVQIGDYTNVTLPKGTIIYNLPGGVFAHHRSLKSYEGGQNKYFNKPTFRGISVRQKKDTIVSIEKNSKILESVNEGFSSDAQRKAAFANGYEEKDKKNEGKKRFKRQDGIGKAKYTISFHDGKKKHKDGSDFFDIKIFKNKKDLSDFVGTLAKQGYKLTRESVNEACWDTHKQVGTKTKGGKQVPNCVPKGESVVKEDKKQIKDLVKKVKHEKLFYDLLATMEKKYGKQKYRIWLEKSLKDFGVNSKHYDYRTNAGAEEKLFQLGKK